MVKCFIGAGAVITKDVKDYALYTGVPGKQVGWMSAYGEKIDLPLKGNKTWVCKKTNLLYKLIDSNLLPYLIIKLCIFAFFKPENPYILIWEL